MKLYCVYVLDDTEEYIEVVVANSAEEAEQRVSEMDQWDYFISAEAHEISEVDGYKINLEKIK